MSAGDWFRPQAVTPTGQVASAASSPAQGLWRWVRATPSAQVALLCVGQLLLWGLASTLLYSAPEIDGAEQLVWAFSMQQGYWKHPPLPSWIMHGLVAAFGPFVALPFIAAQACVVAALALTWRLACEFMSPQRAVGAMALTSLITYYNVGADAFNHSVALLPFEAAAMLMFYRATRQGQVWRWALAGLFAGLAMLVKYLALLPLSGLLLYFVLDRRLHRPDQFKGLLLAALVAAAVLYPHLVWLQAHDFQPLHYAHSIVRPMASGLATLKSIGDFGFIQTLRLLPLLLGMAYACRWGLRRSAVRQDAGSRPDRGPQVGATVPIASLHSPAWRADRLFLWVGVAAPLAFTVLFSLLTQTELQSRWGTSCFPLLGIWAVVLLTERGAPNTGRAVRFTIVAQVVLCLMLTLSKTVVADLVQHRTRANFPGLSLARHANRTWHELSSAPLHVAVTDIWLGGNLVANSRKVGDPRARLAVLIDGDPLKAPWVDTELLGACGGLVIDDRPLRAPLQAALPSALDTLMERATATGTWHLKWAGHTGPDKDGTTSDIRWGFIPPSDRDACPM